MRKFLCTVAAVVSLAGGAHAEVVIAAMGDSLTQGYGLPAEDGFVPQLDQWLIGQGADVRLINAGVSGDTTAGGAARVGWTLSDEVDGMIVALGANDMLRGIDPEVARDNLATILQAAAEARVPVLLVGFTAPPNYGADYKQAFDAMYPELADRYGVLFAPNFLAGLIADQSDVATVQGYLQPDGLHPTAQGVVKIVEALGPDVLTLVNQLAD